MAQNREVRGVATTVRVEAAGTKRERIVVRYHRTDVVEIEPGRVTLRTGGWSTSTTKLRMNQASNQYALGFTVYSKNHRWYVGWWDGGEPIPFDTDELIVPRRHLRWNGATYEAVA